MKTLFLAYSGDAYLSNSSLYLIGVFTSKQNAINGINEFDGYNLETNDKISLNNINQTQGLEVNYIIEERILNQID